MSLGDYDMKVEFEKAKGMLREILETSGASDADIQTMVELCVSEDLYGKLFSAFVVKEAESRLRLLEHSKDVKEEIVVDKPSLKLIDGHGRSAKLITAQVVVPLITQMAKDQGIAIIAIHNASYNGALEYFTRKIAENDLVGILTCNGGPQGVVPFGGKKDIFGTNPISYAIPTTTTPIAFDAATAQVAYGNIAAAKRHNEALPKDTFLTKEGEFTTDPNMAVALIPFGGYKGYAINLLLEVLTGMMVQAKSGLDQTGNETEIGSIVIAIDPAAFGDIDEFKKSATKLVKDIEAVPAVDPAKPVRVPGMRGEALKQEILSTGLVEVNETDWKDFEAFYNRTIKRS